MSEASKVESRELEASEFERPVITGILPKGSAAALDQPSDELLQALAPLAELSYQEARQSALGAFERAYVQGLLERAGGNVSRAARLAGLDRVYLHRLIRKHSLRVPRRRARTPKEAPRTDIKV